MNPSRARGIDEPSFIIESSMLNTLCMLHLVHVHFPIFIYFSHIGLNALYFRAFVSSPHIMEDPSRSRRVQTMSRLLGQRLEGFSLSCLSHRCLIVYRGDSSFFLMGWHKRGPRSSQGGSIGKVMYPNTSGMTEKGHTAQVPGQLISLFINKNH